MFSVLPFQFEPERSFREEDSAEDTENVTLDEIEEDQRSQERVGHFRWCLCGHCEVMPTVKESVCCKEMDFLAEAVAGIPCITAHEEFGAVCLNRGVLWAALVSLHDRESAALPNRNNVPNRSYRYAAYRQFTWWRHGWLGKKIRRVIPACAVNLIRSVYIEASGVYTGFKDVDDFFDPIEVDEAWIDF